VSMCPWVVADPLCCDCWNTADPRMKEQAHIWASSIMYARTGRQFGTCEVTVRPCGYDQCGDGTMAWYGAWWNGGLWTPYILDGVWFNCACPGLCNCEPDSQMRLDGPVASITEVTIGGVVVDPDNYRVDDFQWLVAENGFKWPRCPNMNNSSGGVDVLEVTYAKGTAVPADVLLAEAILACEYVKMCKGDSSCQLSSRVVAMSRQGTDFQMVPLDDMLKAGLLGPNLVDQVILGYNPNHLMFRPRVWAQNVKHPRQTTFA